MSSGGADSFAWPNGSRAAVSLSFDDARWSQAAYGIPILDRYGVRATFYVLAPGLELQIDNWRRAAAAGHEMGNHTVRHPCSGNFKWARENALENYTLDQMAVELGEADETIEKLLGITPQTFAYPCGQRFVGRGTETRSYVPLIASRFLAGRGYPDEAPNDPLFCDLAQLNGVGSDCLSFKSYREWIDRAVAEGGWLIFAGHDVGEGSQAGTSAPRQTVWSEALEELCAYCTDPGNGIWIDTVAAVASHVAKERGDRTK